MGGWVIYAYPLSVVLSEGWSQHSLVWSCRDATSRPASLVGDDDGAHQSLTTSPRVYLDK